MTRHAASFDEQPRITGLGSQMSIFSVITCLVLLLLLIQHSIFASLLGEPVLPVYLLLCAALALAVLEMLWLRRYGRKLSDRAAMIESCISIAAIFLLTAILTCFTNHDESTYFVLLAIPILQCAYIFSLFLTALTITAADAMIILWLWHFYALHPPARITQYLEIGMLCAVYFLMGLLVWILVNQLRVNQLKLKTSMELLQTTRERLISEEKMAAVGAACQRSRARDS